MSTERLSADEIASKFFEQYPGGTWLSVKQTQWLMGQASRETRKSLKRATGSVSVNGVIVGNWACAVSPINGCGCFTVKDYRLTAAERAEIERNVAAYERALRELSDEDRLDETMQATMQRYVSDLRFKLTNPPYTVV